MFFYPKYFYYAILLFVTEVYIALFFNDRIIRHWVGDVLVILLIYCFLRTFWKIRVTPAIVGVFGFACGIEVLQAFDLVGRLGLRHNRLVATVLGTTFDWKDILAYALGAAIVLVWEHRSGSGKGNEQSGRQNNV
ncbi:MAG: DUF2809 domain-containing protein [Elainella sp. Prado103]|jgi:hypothetical protein|nr:DUF2809 domain-containing protein [Elainella sp. Prado103]